MDDDRRAHERAQGDELMAVHQIRRMRRTVYVTDEQEWIFHNRLRIDLETGIGDSSGSDPQIMLRWSDDGCHTWSNEHWRSAGKIGQYRARAVWNRLGRSRQRVYEHVMTNAGRTAIIAAELDIEKGRH